MAQAFEAIMLICFGISWPFNIAKSLKSRTAKGKSLQFEICVVVGYLFGIAGKFIGGNVTYVLAVYILDVLMVSTDIVLTCRNRRGGKRRERCGMKLVLASKNQKKLVEMNEILSHLGIQVCSEAEAGVDVEVEETGATFEENSLLKARAVMEASGMPAIADDSGLCVDALNGAPGVYSARYGGEGLDDAGRYRLLLENMRGQTPRTAKFVSVITCCFPNGDVLSARGECPGTIAFAPMGEGGFGYDPVFFIPSLKKTFAQLSPEEKNAISHRGKALEAFQVKLEERNYYGRTDKQTARPAAGPGQQHRHHSDRGQGRHRGQPGEAGRRRFGGPGAHQGQGAGEFPHVRPGGGGGPGPPHPQRGGAGHRNKICIISSKPQEG